MSKKTRALRLSVARVFSGISYNLAAVAYLIIVAVLVSIALQYYAAPQGSGVSSSPADDIMLLRYSVQASVLSTIIALVVAFVVGALSLLLLVWVPYKVAMIGSFLTHKISRACFENSQSGMSMFISKILLYSPALMLLIALYFIFSSLLMFQLLIAGTGLLVAAVVFAALRVAIIR